MWQFAVGLYLVDLSPGSLRLVAAFGFSRGTAAVLLGALIGDMVDKYPRLTGNVIKCPLIPKFFNIFFISIWIFNFAMASSTY